MNFNGYPSLQAVLNEWRHSYVHMDRDPMNMGEEVWKHMLELWEGFSPDELSRIEEDIAALQQAGPYSRGYYVTREALILVATEDRKISFYPIRCRDIIWIYTSVITQRVNGIPTGKIFCLNAVDAFQRRIRFCQRSAAPFDRKNLMEEDLEYLIGKLLPDWPGILWGYSADRAALYTQNFSELTDIVRKRNAAGERHRQETVSAGLKEMPVGLQQKNTKAALVLRSPDRGYIFLIKSPEFLLGRGIDVDGRIRENLNIGRRHCMIRRKGGKFFIRDLQSMNGTFLNGQRLEPNVDCRLYDGDEIMLCTQKFIVSISHG